MTEPRSDAQPLRRDAAVPPARRPFVRPAVEDLGKLRELTLIGGSL